MHCHEGIILANFQVPSPSPGELTSSQRNSCKIQKNTEKIEENMLRKTTRFSLKLFSKMHDLSS